MICETDPLRIINTFPCLSFLALFLFLHSLEEHRKVGIRMTCTVLLAERWVSLSNSTAVRRSSPNTSTGILKHTILLQIGSHPRNPILELRLATLVWVMQDFSLFVRKASKIYNSVIYLLNRT